MNFHRPYGLELQPLPRGSVIARAHPAAHHRSRRVRQVVWSVLGLATAAGLAATASATLLLIIAAVAVGLLALLTAACIYVQNNAAL